MTAKGNANKNARIANGLVLAKVQSVPKIDAHQHYWKMSRGDYGWLSSASAKLQRDFLPAELKPHMEEAGVDGTVVVQAAATQSETIYLESLTRKHSWILGVVGWVDMSHAESAGHLNRLAAGSKLVGIRPMLQDIDGDDWILKQAKSDTFAELIKLDLAFDALVTERHLKHLSKLLELYPNMRVVIDHAAKPAMSGRPQSEWVSALLDLASHPTVWCKYSGLVTEMDEVSMSDLQNYVDVLVDAFSVDRLIWGSDWPVVTERLSYVDWFKFSTQLLQQLSESELSKVYGANAMDFYKLEHMNECI